MPASANHLHRAAASSAPPTMPDLNSSQPKVQSTAHPARAESHTPLEHFAAFYQLQNNQPLTDEQAAFCQQLIDEIWKEGDNA